jgi:poly(A) polymerase
MQDCASADTCILRFFRFTAEYSSGPPDAEGIAAAVAERQGLAGLSSERVRAELVRLLAAPGAVPVCRAMAAHGLLTAIVPVAPRLETFARLAAIERASANAPDAALRLAALAVAVADDVPRFGHRSFGRRRGAGARRARSNSGGGWGEDAPRGALPPRAGCHHQQVMLAWARSTAAADDGAWRRLAELPARWPVPVMPYSGRDVVERGVPPGPRVGACLAAFEAWWIAEDFRASGCARRGAGTIPESGLIRTRLRGPPRPGWPAGLSLSVGAGQAHDAPGERQRSARGY